LLAPAADRLQPHQRQVSHIGENVQAFKRFAIGESRKLRAKNLICCFALVSLCQQQSNSGRVMRINRSEQSFPQPKRAMNIQRFTASCALLLTAIFASHTLAADAPAIAVESGQKIAFLGDSITSMGAASPSGYVRLVISGLEANGIKATAIGAGVSGNTSRDMIARLDRDVISRKPNWVTMSCGVNDVWHGKTGVVLDQYEKNLTEMVDRCQAAGIHVMILTSTVIHEEPQDTLNQQLVAYNEFLRKLATEKKCLFADLNADVQAGIKEALAGPHPTGNLLTIDGVHMNPMGNQVMATGILKAFGLNEAQIGKAHEAWLDIPEACELPVKATVTIRQYERLRQLAAEKKTNVNKLMDEALTKALESLVGNEAKSTASK
jgi:lysophospholipase L1-like esterase